MSPVAKMLIDMAKFYDQPLDDRQLEMYVQLFRKVPTDVVLKAGQAYCADSGNTRFPMPPHKILERFTKGPDSKDLARQTAMRIAGAVSRFGWNNAKDAKEYIGEVGWKTVEDSGGWLHLCENLGSEISQTTFIAQARDAIEAQINLQRAGIDTNLPVIEGSTRIELNAAVRARLNENAPILVSQPGEPQHARGKGLATIGDILKTQLENKK